MKLPICHHSCASTPRIRIDAYPLAHYGPKSFDLIGGSERAYFMESAHSDDARYRWLPECEQFEQYRRRFAPQPHLMGLTASVDSNCGDAEISAIPALRALHKKGEDGGLT